MVHVLTADETGLVKLIALKSKDVVSKCGTQSRVSSVAAITFLPTSFSNGKAKSAGHGFAASISKAGLLYVWDLLGQKSSLAIHNCGTDPIFLSYWQANFVIVARNGSIMLVPFDAKDGSNPKYVVGTCESPVYCAALHRDSGTLAIGGQEVDVSLWSLATVARSGKAEQTWKAKNVAHTNLELRLPIWVKSIAFLPSLCGDSEAHGKAAGTGGAAGKAQAQAPCPHVLAVATHYMQVRVYDSRINNRRPVRELTLGDYPFTALAASPDGQWLYTGDAAGFMHKVSCGPGSEALREAGAYRGCAGAVKCLAVHPDPSIPYLASVGLDRTLRVYNADTRQMVRRLHLRQRLTAVAWPAAGAAAGDKGGASIADIEPEGPSAKAGSGERALVWQAYAEKEKARLAALATQASQAQAAQGEGKRKAAAGGEGEEDDVWAELERRRRAAAASASASAVGPGKRRKVADEQEEEEEEEGDEDEEGEEDSEDLGMGDSDEEGDEEDEEMDDDDEDDDDDDDDDDEEEEEEELPPPPPPPQAKKAGKQQQRR